LGGAPRNSATGKVEDKPLAPRGDLRVITPTGVVAAHGHRLRLGRDPSNDVVLDHPSVSRFHAIIEPRDDGWVLVDTSTTGTYCEGSPVHERILSQHRTSFEMPRNGVPVEVIWDTEGFSKPVSEAAGTGFPSSAPIPAVDELGRLTHVTQIGASQSFTIGRAPENDVVLANDLAVSRLHAVLQVKSGVAVITDRNSFNGTFVNGVRVRQVSLSPGDIVSVGSATLRYIDGQLEQYEDSGAAWLTAESISARRGKAIVLRDVSLAIAPSSLVAVVGPSGAGKTTLMESLTGIVPPQYGTVRYGGRRMARDADEWRLRLGYVPQEDLIHGHLTIKQALDYAARLRFPPDVSEAARASRINEVLSELGIVHRANLSISQLSGGQRKRTSIAVELLTKPGLLFLDEPTSGLDPGNEEHVTHLLKDLAREGRIVIVTTHSLSSLDLCDYVLFLAVGGHVAYYGPPKEAGRYFASHGWGETWPEVFQALDEQRRQDWADQYGRDSAYARYVATPLQRRQRADQPAPGPAAAHGRPSVARQTSILMRRYLAILAADRRALLLLLAQAPVFAFLIVLLFPSNVMLATGKAFDATMLIWLLVVAVTWLGTSNAVREIVKERPIVRREANVGVSMTAYYLSKAIVLTVITAIQTIVFITLAMLPQALPATDPSNVVSIATRGIVAGDQRLEIVFALLLVGWCAVAVGLLLSTLVKTSDQAMLLLPVILMAHVVVSAPAFAAPTGAVAVGALASSASWGMDAAAATVDLNMVRENFLSAVNSGTSGAQPPTTPQTGAQSSTDASGNSRAAWNHTIGAWGSAVLALIALFVGASAAGLLLLHRQMSGRLISERQA